VDPAAAIFRRAVESFRANVSSISDVFGLVDPDSPELTRYTATLEFLARRPQRADGDGPPRVCDLGGYYGLLAAAIGELGYAVDVVDDFGSLMTDADHEDLRAWWRAKRIQAHDVDLQRADLRLPFEDQTFDFVTFLAVIEHFPHTPRHVLAEIRRVLRPDGLLILDTPNAGAFGTRVGFLLHGEGLWSEVGELYNSEIPFRGHSRCYGFGEISSILDWAGFVPEEHRLFDLAPHRSASLRARVLYGFVYGRLLRRFERLRGYIWVTARPKGAGRGTGSGSASGSASGTPFNTAAAAPSMKK
jgi:SAM-dependent methyltransferase